MLSLFAAAKINLSLRVRGRRPDGYHELESLVAFADIGDRLVLKKATETSLKITGPFAAGLSADVNLVLAAQALLAQKTGKALAVEMVLKKNLPVAAGLGGGSADAAAVLRGLAEMFDLDEILPDAAAILGADVPVCLQTAPAWMTGIGETISRLNALPASDIVLVNPRVSLATAQVFDALGAASELKPPQAPPTGFENAAALIEFLRAQGNDLLTPAAALAPEINLCLAALREAGAPFSAMSGSGASCFALCSPGSGKALAARYRTLREKDWVVSGGVLA